MKLFTWSLYSKKMAQKIATPHSCGSFSLGEAQSRGMRFVEASAGSHEEGNQLSLFWLIDPEDGVIVDCKYQLFGDSALLAAAEAATQVLVGKNHDQAGRISADLIDRQLRDSSDKEAFPQECYGHLNLVIDAIDHGVEQCQDIPLGETYASPIQIDGEQTSYPGWEKLSTWQKLKVIEEVVEKEIRPYIELDQGGIELVELKGNELVISYKGACTSCFSAIGATLSTITQILQSKVHPDLRVSPNMDELEFA